MRRLAFVSALILATTPLAANAQKTGKSSSGSTSHASSGSMHSSAAEQRMLQQNQQQMLKQQQEFERAQQKAFEQEQKAMQQQAREQHQMLLNQIRAARERTTQNLTNPATVSKEMASASKTAGTTQTHASTTRHGRSGSRIVYRTFWYNWPRSSSSAVSRNLTTLKKTLDQIATSRKPLDDNNARLQTSLYNVHNSSAIAPSQAHVQKLANDLTSALVGRAQGEAPVDTKNLALHLRAVMNTPYLTVPEFEKSLTEHSAILTSAKAEPEKVQTVVKDIQTLAEDVLTRSL
jgi:hypothetical protein